MARRKKTDAAGVRLTCRELVMKAPGEIIPYPGNAKRHSPEQIRRLRSSLREFGFVRPLLIDGAGNLLAGHGTLEAAVAEGMDQVPCVLAEGLTEAQRRAYILADNRLAELADWDLGQVDLELRALTDLGLDLDLTGFDMEDLAPSLPEDGAVPEDPSASDPPESSTRTEKLVTCPSCGCQFRPTRKRG